MELAASLVHGSYYEAVGTLNAFFYVKIQQLKYPRQKINFVELPGINRFPENYCKWA